MREIKFRAWDSKYKRWSYPTSRLIHDDHIFILYGLEDYIHVMQYTGLKDKNGVEIYEGDIVKIVHEGKHKEILPVVFNRGQFLREGSQLSLAGDLSNYGGKVLGNIYENPELLS